MKLSLSRRSRRSSASFAEDVAAYAAAGFDAIGIWEFKLPDDDEANTRAAARAGLASRTASRRCRRSCRSRSPAWKGPPTRASGVEAICASIRRLAAYEPECVLCLAGPLGERSEAEGRRSSWKACKQRQPTAREAASGSRFEPIHRSQRDTAAFVNSIADAVDVLDEAGLADVGLLLDLYHVWDDPAFFDFVGRASYRIAGVHVADWPA